MSLTLVAGPANAAKAGEVFARYRSALARAEAPLLVVPRREDVAAYTRELAGGGALTGGRIVPFGGLVREIARRTGVGGRPLGGEARARLLQRAVAGTRLDALARSAGAPGFVRAFGELEAELSRAGVPTEALAAALAPHGDHGRELLALHRRYREELDRAGREDEEGYGWHVVRALRAHPAAWARVPVLLYGFDDLTALQAHAVESLAGAAEARVVVSLPYEARAAFAGRATTWEELRPLAGEIVQLEASADFYAPAGRAALHHLERGLWEEDAAPWDPSPDAAPAEDAVRLLAAAGERAEAEGLAAEVARLAAEGGIPYEEMAVVLRRPGPAAALLGRTFASVGIPLAGERRLPAATTALGRGLIGLVRSALLPAAPLADLLAWLRTPGHVHETELVDGFEADCRQRGVTRARDGRVRWEALHPTWRLDALDVLARAARTGRTELADAVRAAAERLWAAPLRHAAPVLDAAGRDAAAVLAAVLRVLDELEEVGGASPEELLAALAALEARAGDPARPGAVTLTDPLGIRARRFRAVLVGGLSEGEFPLAARPEPLLPDEARGALAGRGFRLRREVHAEGEERYLFYACASRATEVLVLSSRTADEEGNVALGSPFVAEVRRLFPGLEPRERTLSDVVWPPAPPEPLTELPLDRPLGNVERPEVRELLRHTEVLSASAIELYAHCPVRWLVERELRPAEFEPKPDAIARGSFIHAVLRRTHEALRARTGTARVTDVAMAEAELRAALAAERAELDAALAPIPAESAARSAEADLAAYLERAVLTSTSAFEPTEFEWAFGMARDGEEGNPPLVIGAGGHEVRLRGAIDRVDVDAHGHAVVRDYKSGRSESDMPGAKWRGERRLQVALYLVAARELLGLLPAGGLYVPLRVDGDKRARGLLRELPEFENTRAYCKADVRSPEEFDAELEAITGEVVELADRLRAGDLTPSPSTCGWDHACAYPGICRSAQR